MTVNQLSFLCFLFNLIWYVSDATPFNRFSIVGGENATISDYPYQVSIAFEGQHGCGGSIINNLYILTAAHCTYDVPAEEVSIRVNSSYRNEGGQLYKVRKIYVHPEFNDNTYDYDISILELETRLTFGEGVKPITIASAGTQIIDGLEGVATGWGRLGEHKQTSHQLQVVTLPVISTESCAYYYPEGFVTERMFCAGYDEGGKDTCEGDSGGPLVISGIQIGLVSWGIVCAAPKEPGAFTKLTEFEDYINSIVY